MRPRHRSFFYKGFHKHPAVFIGSSLILIFMGSMLLWVSTFRMPSLDSFENRKVSQSTKIYDRTGKILLYDVFQGAKRTVVPYTEISRNIKNATVAIEDSTFYEHSGVRPVSFLRAVIVNLTTGGYSQGGSTITQQVVKNALLTANKEISRKLKEWVLAWRLEKILSKEEILSIYLNETSYGGNVYGVEEASKEFFGKSAKDVTLAEAAYLAAIPQATTYFSPYGKNKDKLEERKNLVLRRMFELSFITEEEYEKTKSETVVFTPQEESGIKAPHFVMYVKELLENRFGKNIVENGGLSVITTLNWELQEKAEEMVKARALENEKNFNAENASLVAIDPHTGDILSMVGSRDYFDKNIDGNFNVSLGKRQPGSTMKPIVYAKAFEKGYTPETVLFDVPTEFSSYCNPDGTPIKPTDDPEEVCYKPSNYDDTFRGPMTLRDALAQSINIPAVKTLYLAGINDSIRLGRAMGLSTLVNSDMYGLTLVLGGGEVTLLELTNAYGVFATGGTYYPHQAIVSVKDKTNNVIYSKATKGSPVLDQTAAEYIQDILSDNKARTPAYGPNSVLNFKDRDVAVKTGTTNDYRDAWTIGFSPNLVVGVWAGNNDNSPMEKKVAGQIVAPLWSDYMHYALSKFPSLAFNSPKTPEEDLKPVLRGVWQGGNVFEIDSISQKLATEYTPEETRKEIIVPEIHSILYWLYKNDPRGPKPEKPENDSQFEKWEYGVSLWAKENGMDSPQTVLVPTEVDTIHTPENMPQIQVSGIYNNSSFTGTIPQITLSNSGKFPLQKVVVYLNGNYLVTLTGNPFQLNLNASQLEELEARNELRFIAYDSVFNKSEVSISFMFSR